MLHLPLLNILASFIVAAFITWYSIPKIIKVVNLKNLFDVPGGRKIHERKIPTLGGISIFGGFFISMLLFVNGYLDHLSVVCASLMFIFFMGEKDDLITMAPRKKIMIEIAAAIVIVIGTNLRITSLHGLLGVATLPGWVSIVLTVLVILFIMNAFNLIDGIDGLAAGIGIFASVLFGIWFWMAKDIGYAVICASVTGALVAFLPYNYHKGNLKIFMGDTGSLTVGFLLAILSIQFNEINLKPGILYSFNSAPAIILSILILPIFDALRVFLIRLYNKKNPFSADANHLHHRLIRLGYSHVQITLVFIAASGFFVLLSYLLDGIGTGWLFMILLGTATVISYVTLYIENKIILMKSIGQIKPVAKAFYKKTG